MAGEPTNSSIITPAQNVREEWLRWIRETKYIIETKYCNLTGTVFYSFYKNLLHLEQMITLTGITPSVFADIVLHMDAAMKTYLKPYDLPPMPKSLLEYARSI